MKANSHAEAVIDLAAIAHNTRLLAAHAGQAAVMAIVKADGYNHGAVQVARTVLANGAAEIGVTTIDEALALRVAGITAPVLSWLNTLEADYAAAIAADVEIGVSSPGQLRAVAAAARRTARTAVLTIKVDTGLNRNGVPLAEVGALASAIGEDPALRLRGLFSHLALADQPHNPIVDEQAARFIEAIELVQATGQPVEVAHLANSAATLTRTDLHFDMVRPGIALYGLSPVPELGDFGLRRAMTLRTSLALVKPVAAGEGVSYGHEWIAPHDTVAGLVPLGYADGITRALGGRFEVWIGGRRFPSIGRVCMDQFVVDLGPDGGGVAAGDEVIVFGPGERGEPTADEWASLLSTIHYEVVTGVRGRVGRTFTGASAATGDITGASAATGDITGASAATGDS